MSATHLRELPNFRDYCEAACIKLWGEPDQRDRKQLRWDGGDGYSDKSFNRQKKAWYDHGEKRGGSTLDLVAYEKGQPKHDLRGAAFFDTWAEAHKMGIVPDEPPKANGKGKGQGGPILATYPYHDESGQLLFEVVRFATSDPNERFRQRRPDGAGGWIWNVKGVRSHVLYRLPQLIEAAKAGQRLLICEGERDVLTAVSLGFAATTMPGGVGKWRSEYNRFFESADVVIVSDNDPQAKDPKTGAPRFHPGGAPILPGQDHAASVARHLRKAAAHVRVITPGDEKDLTAWREAGGTKAAFETLIASAPDLIKARPEPEPEPAPDADGAGLEDAVALQFAAQHGQDYRYVALTGKWMIWRGTRWQAETTLSAFDPPAPSAAIVATPTPRWSRRSKGSPAPTAASPPPSSNSTPTPGSWRLPAG
jgi:hypothetical protein